MASTSGNSKLRDIADRVGCSVATVSSAINGCGRMTEKMQEALLAKCGELNFVLNSSNSSDQSLHLQRTDTYQGWFGAPGDGEGSGWRHSNSQKTRKFEPGHLGIEFWPDMSEFAAHERFDTSFRHTDHYLWLVGEATKRVRGELPFTPELPKRTPTEAQSR